MNTLNEIMQMKKQGKTENEIIDYLKEKGVTPNEINDSLNQANIKSAVASEYESPQKTTQQEELYTPQQQEETYEQSYIPQQQESYQPQGESYYPQENYENYSQGTDTDTIIEIAEHVFLEKIKDIQKQVSFMDEFKNITKSKVENIEERLKRIESTIDSLQSAILEKIGEYGNNIQGIKNELNMMQDSFGKVIKEKSMQSPTQQPPQKTIQDIKDSLSRPVKKKIIRK